MIKELKILVEILKDLIPKHYLVLIFCTIKRTSWATEHIFQIKDLQEAKNYFNKVAETSFYLPSHSASPCSTIEVHYFHLISWLAFPFLRFPGGKLLLKSLDFIDKILLKLPFLRKYAFKIVFVFSQPKKSS